MTGITDERITKYLEGLWRPLTPRLEQLREEGERRGVPIIRKETESLLLTLLKLKKPERILEIGTSAGYSALCMAEGAPSAEIVTLEIRDDMRNQALEHFAAAEAGGRILSLKAEAVEWLTERRRLEEAPYNFVFLDGGHSHYQDIWQAFRPLCRPGTVVMSDDVLFRGMTASDEFLDERRNRTIMNRMREYLDFITNLPGVSTVVLPSGDGAAVSVIE